MALFGDFGKIFLGGATTADVGGAIGGFFGAEEGGRVLGKGAADFTGRVGDTLGFGDKDVVTSGKQAGIDSPATLSGVSQTSSLSGFPNTGGFGQSVDAGFGLVGP